MVDKGWSHCGYNKKTGRPEFVSDGNSTTVVEEALGNSPTAKIWSLLWEWRHDIEGTLTDIAKCAGISRTSLYKVWDYFERNEIIIPAKYKQGVQYYKLNKNSYIGKQMINLLDLIIEDHVEKTLAMENVKDKLSKEYKKGKRK